MEEQYAKTLYSAFLEKDQKDFDIFFDSFIQTLKRKKILKVLPKILNETIEIERIEQKANKTTLTMKNKDIFSEIKDKINLYKDNFDLENMEIKEDENMIGGFILKNNKNILDNSYKTKLVDLYKEMIR